MERLDTLEQNELQSLIATMQTIGMKIETLPNFEGDFHGKVERLKTSLEQLIDISLHSHHSVMFLVGRLGTFLDSCWSLWWVRFARIESQILVNPLMI